MGQARRADVTSRQCECRTPPVSSNGESATGVQVQFTMSWHGDAEIRRPMSSVPRRIERQCRTRRATRPVSVLLARASRSEVMAITTAGLSLVWESSRWHM
jgi:hypothetical protein